MRRKETVKHWFGRVAVASAASLALGIGGCSGGGSASGADGAKDGVRAHVVVSIAPLEYFVKAIGGDSVEVTTVMPRGADPETFDPGVSAMKGLHDADLFLTVGLLPFEERLEERAGKVEVCHVSDGVELIYGTHEAGTAHRHEDELHSHHHGAADPHVWSSVTGARVIAANVTAALSETDPERSAYYRTQGARFAHRLDSLEAAWGGRMAGSRGKSFMVWHPSLSYFARDYGLNQIPLNIENKENSSVRLRAIIEEAEKSGAAAYFVARGTDRGQVRTVGDALGLSPVEIDVMNPDWEHEMESITDAFATGGKELK